MSISTATKRRTPSTFCSMQRKTSISTDAGGLTSDRMHTYGVTVATTAAYALAAFVRITPHSKAHNESSAKCASDSVCVFRPSSSDPAKIDPATVPVTLCPPPSPAVHVSAFVGGSSSAGASHAILPAAAAADAQHLGPCSRVVLCE